MAALPLSWDPHLAKEVCEPYFAELQEFVASERRRLQVFPPEEQVFNALRLTPIESVKAVILGQDPYHDVGQAHGLCFSVARGVKPPPSLKNILKELQDDIGCAMPAEGCLESWALQGVLLLNAVLSVRAHEPNSHRERGWERFTDAVLRVVNAKAESVAFVLWGASAQKKAKLIDQQRHLVLQSAHPSPLSARNGFFGSRPFSKINAFLRSHGRGEIDWILSSGGQCYCRSRGEMASEIANLANLRFAQGTLYPSLTLRRCSCSFPTTIGRLVNCQHQECQPCAETALAR